MIAVEASGFLEFAARENALDCLKKEFIGGVQFYGIPN
jgi:hypothetical protein